MANVYDGKITPNVDWGGDSNTGGLPVSGRRVQEFIKEQLELRATKAELAKLEQQLSGKAGTFYYDKDNARYLVFADKESQEAYLADVSKTELILGSFAAGGGTSTENIKVVINLETPMYNAIPLGSKGNYINFSFDTVNDSGMPTGESVIVTYTITRGANTVTRKEAYRFGANVSFGIDDYIGEGTNVVTVKVMGQTSLASTTFAITFDAINLSIKDYLDISKVYNLKNNAVAYLEIPYDITGSYTKVMEWYLDGVKLELNRTEDEILETVPTSRVKTIELSNLSQGRHSIQFRAGSKINGEMFYSDILYRDFFIYTEANYDFMMGVAVTLPASQGIVEGGLTISGMTQYVSHTFQVASYSPTNIARTDISIYLDDELVGNVTSRNGLVSNVVVTPSTSGSKTLKLTADTLTYTIPTEVKATNINISEITDGLQLSFSAKGRNNNSSDRDTWTDGKQTATLTGFQWNNQSGWVNNRLEINAGAQLHIAYSPLASHDNGKTLEFEWMSKNVSNEDAILCDLRNDEGTGIVITATAISVVSSNKATMEYRYKTDENVRMSVVINPDRGVNKGLTFLYINGVVSKAVNIVTGDNYKSNAEIVFQGTSEAGVSLKDIKVYNTALSTEQILNNYNLYRDTVAEMLEVYNANDIYDGTSYDLVKMSSRLPVMLVTGDIPTLENTNDKDTQIIVDIEYTNMQDSSRSFVMRGAAMRPQGTSSMGYPKKNFRIYTRKVDGTTLEVNGTPVEDKLYAFKPKSIPVDCWCLKADYAESSGTHNTAIARMWGDAFKNAQVTVDLGEGNPHNTNNEYKLRTKAQQAAIDSKYPYDVRTTIDGLPILLFYRREPNAEVIFLGKYNFNNDKSTEKVFGFTDIPGFDNTRMQCWELLNNGNSIGLFTDISDFYNDVTVDGKVMKGWQAAFESRYPDTKTPKTDDLYNFASWINGVDGEAERFAEEKWNHLDVYKVAGYYCYLYRHAGADQFVKNAMLTSEDGEHFYFILYDNDTINGLNNSGDIAILPTDDRNSTYANGSHKFAGHDSVLWNMLEGDEEFMEVVRAVDNALYSAGISYANAVRYFDEEQASKWVERVYNLDAEYKYISPYTNNGTNNLFMLQGNRSIHRKWWLSNRYSLYDSLFVSGAYKSGYVEIKCVDETMPTQRFTVTSGYPLYYGYGINGKLRQRTDIQLAPNSAYTFAIDEKVNLGDPIAIYGAPHIKALDLSMMVSRISVLQLAGVYDEVLGTRLENLKLGGASTENTTLKEISGIKSAKALTSLEVTNLKALTALDLSENVYLQELKAGGTNIASVVFAEGAPLSYVKLPSTFKTLSLKSLPFLETSGIDHENFYVVETINITDCPSLSNNFDWVFTWYEHKRVENSKATLVMDNINWQNVDYRELLALANIGTLSLKGKVKITEGSQEIIDEIKSVFGDNVFNKTSDFYVQAPDGVYLSGSAKLLEGESTRYICAVFSEEEGRIQFSLPTSRQGCSIDATSGRLTTTENGLATSDIVVRAVFISASGKVIDTTMNVTIEKRSYPTAITIEGNALVSEEISTFTLTTTPAEVTGLYRVDWTLGDNSAEYLTIEESDNTTCVVKRIKEGVVETTLIATMVKLVDGTTTNTVTKNISVVLPGVVITKSSNAPLQECLYKNGLVAHEDYSEAWELALITADQLQPGTSEQSSIFYPYRNTLLSIEELQYFKGLTSIPKMCFYASKCEKFIIPENVVTLEGYAFASCKARVFYFPKKLSKFEQYCFDRLFDVDEIHISSVEDWLNIEFDTNTTPFNAYNGTYRCLGHVYVNGERIKEIVLDGSITTIPRYSFDGWNIERVIVNSAEVTMGHGAFSFQKNTDLYINCDNSLSLSSGVIRHLYIGENVLNLSGGFISCTLKQVHIDTLEHWFNITFASPNANPIGTAGLYVNGNLIEDVEIPSSVSELKAYSLRSSLFKSVKIHAGVTSIEEKFILNGGSITSVIIAENNQRYSSEGNCIIDFIEKKLIFSNNYSTIPDYIEVFGNACVASFTGEMFNIPANLKTISGTDYLLSSVKKFNLKNLHSWVRVGGRFTSPSYTKTLYLNGEIITDFVIPNDAELRLSGYTFQKVELNSVTVPENISNLSSAFSNALIEKVIFKHRTQPLEASSSTFSGTKNLKEIHVDDLETYMLYDTNQHSIFYNSNYKDESKLYIGGELAENIVIPEGTTAINTGLFQYIACLKSITIPSTLKNPHYQFLHGCKNVNTIVSKLPSVAFTGGIYFSSPFGNSVDTYTGRNTYNTGENILYVPQGATGYDTGQWLDPLQNAEKCGFTISYTL